MRKKFKIENDVGIEVEYTLLGVLSNNGKNYVVYTNHLPADNQFGKRVLAGELISEEPLNIKKLRKKEEKEITDLFIGEVLSTGKTIKKNKE